MPDHIITGIFSIVCAAIGGLFGYRSAIGATVRKERNEAAIEFQSAFYPTLAKIDTTISLDAYTSSFPCMTLVNILREDFPRHVMAYQKFRQYLAEEKRVDFDAAWSEYSQENGKTYVHLGKYFNPAIHADHLKERTEAIKNIRNILSFAELNHKSPFESNLP